MRKEYKKTIDFYNNNSIEYAKKSGVVFSKFLDIFISKIKKKEVLDIGCGPGHDSDYFYSNGIRVLGIDMSHSMINLAKRRYGKKIKFEINNVLDDDFFSKYKIKNLWMSALIMHFSGDDRSKFLKSVNNFIESVGMLGMIVPKSKKGDLRKINWEKNGCIFNTFSKKDINLILKEGDFKVIFIKEFIFRKQPWWFIVCKNRKN